MNTKKRRIKDLETLLERLELCVVSLTQLFDDVIIRPLSEITLKDSGEAKTDRGGTVAH